MTSQSGRAATRARDAVRVPPIKTQGIKTKLVPFIRGAAGLRGGERWVEPFLGSGVVMFNVAAGRALAGESNPHIVDFYRGVQDGRITARGVREFLTGEGRLLARDGEAHYYAVRDRFNGAGDPLDFLFLNRAGFNGMVRFNSRGKYNVPFCRRPGRFSKAYVTKISNQVSWASSVLRGARDWTIRTADWRDTVQQVGRGDFLYLDPPYSGRSSSYYDAWGAEDLEDLAEFLAGAECRFALSLWYENRYRRNGDVESLFGGFEVRKREHFYHVGSAERLRNAVTEALITN